MKRVLCFLGIVSLFVLTGCSQTSASPQDDTVRFPQYETRNFPPNSGDNVFSH